MPKKKLHRWLTAKEGRKVIQWCEMCGVDRTPATEAQGCRPTQNVFKGMF